MERLVVSAHWVEVTWYGTVALVVALFALASFAPYSRLERAFPLAFMFNPRKNLDLDLQSVCYAMTHTTWFGRVSHFTIFIDAFLWFVVFNHISPAVGLIVLAVMAYQATAVGERAFTSAFLGLGAVYYAGSLWFGQSLGWSNAWLVSIGVLMANGMLRFVGHWVEPAPPLLLDDSDRFVPIRPSTANWKLALMPVYGYVAEIASGLPNRLFAVQVNYLCQRIAGWQPKKTLPWDAVQHRAAEILRDGYGSDGWMGRYYALVSGDSSRPGTTDQQP